jgi:hypothetical protein
VPCCHPSDISTLRLPLSSPGLLLTFPTPSYSSLSTPPHPLTHTDKIQPADICQGQVGDCWLMSAIACLAQVPGAIQRNFVIREVSLKREA